MLLNGGHICLFISTPDVWLTTFARRVHLFCVSTRQVFDSIKSQTVTVGSIKEQLFDQNGNGNIGFSIYNIQKQGNGYVYTPVRQNFVC